MLQDVFIFSGTILDNITLFDQTISLQDVNNAIKYVNADKFILKMKDGLNTEASTPLEECERRDVKGLYAKARRGEIRNFTGISAPFEAPEHPALSLDTSVLSVEESVNQLLALILPKVTINRK